MYRVPVSWFVYSLERSYPLLGMTINGVSQSEAQQLSDGPDGWTILEIMCHVRDYQEIFIDRVERMVEEDHPTLKPFDEVARVALFTQNQYAQQNLMAVFDDYVATRLKFIDYVGQLEDSQLTRTGLNPLRGDIDVMVEIYHTFMHDVDHGEQIARVRGLTLPRP